MKKLFYTMIFAGVFAVSANAAINKSEDGYYHLKTEADLNEFVTLVNKDKSADEDHCPNAKMDNNINYDVSTNASNNWIPLKGFCGIFDGQGYTLDYLRYDGSSNASFIDDAIGGAVLKNLNIGANTTFSSSANLAGLIVDINTAMDIKKTDGTKVYTDAEASIIDGRMMIIDGCSFSGKLTPKRGANNIGGLVATVNGSAKLTISSTYYAGKITNTIGDRRALIAYSGSEKVNVVNVYYTNIENTSKTGDAKLLNGSVTKTQVAKGTDENTIKNNIETYNTKEKDNILQYYDTTGLQKNFGIYGMTFTKEGNNLVGTTVTDSKDIGAKMTFPYDVNVDVIRVTREFTPGRWSTIMLPFDFIDNYYTGTTGNTKETTGAKFYELTGMNVVEGKWKIQAQRIQTLVANTPYLILPTAETKTLTFSGKVALKQTTAGTQAIKDENGTDWTFTGVYAAEQWNVERPPFDETNPKGYQIYGFAGQDQDEKGITAGNFVKVGYNVQIQPLRAYLYYPGSDGNPDVADPTPNPSGMPALNKAPRALAKTAAESFELPDNIEVIINEDPIIIESLIIPPAPVVEEDSTGNESGNTDEGNDENQEGTTGIAKPVAVPTQNKQANWYDLKGRRMGNKPQAQGTYIKNRTPVIVK